MSFMHHLQARLSQAEQSLLYGDVASADSGAVDVLRDLVSLYSTGSGRLLTPAQHTCSDDGCVCEAAMILHIQCCFELNRTEAFMREQVVEAFYGRPRDMTFNVFVVWLQYHLAYQRYEFCCQELIAYIDAHFSPSSTSQVALSSGESNGRYLQLMEMLLFHVLVPLRAYDEAIEFLRKGKKHRPGHSAEKDQRISPEMKEAWVRDLLELQAGEVSHALAASEAAQRLSDEDENDFLATNSTTASATAATPAGSEAAAYHAGLASLHDTAFYTQLPPARLPIVDGDATQDDESALKADGAGASPVSSDGTSSALSATTSSASSQLLPFPPLQPLWPNLTSHTFDLATYLESLCHRVYALLHTRAPLVANRLRRTFNWFWSKRATISTLLTACVALRLLLLLVAYFKLAELPGVALLVGELRNFIKIAFITGTGRSLFA